MKTASDLGRGIAAHGTFRRLRDAEAAVREDATTRQLLDAFEAQRQKIGALEAQRQPVEVSDKHEMQRLSDAARLNPLLQELLRAQADYMTMMTRVNTAIRDAMEPAAPPDEKAPT